MCHPLGLQDEAMKEKPRKHKIRDKEARQWFAVKVMFLEEEMKKI